MSSQLKQLYIVATGMITPVGMNSQMTAASVNAAINVYNVSSYHNGKIDAIKMTHVPEDALPPLADSLVDALGLNARQVRMLKLADPALKEVLSNVNEPVPLFLAGPEPLPVSNSPLPMRSVFLKHLQMQTEITLDFDNSKVFPMGRAAVFCALESAFEFLQNSSEKQSVLIGGVDTYWHPMTINALLKEKRIQTEPGQADAFVPGEGAGFLLLTKDENFRHHRKILRPGFAEELGHRYSEEPYQGDGLSQAFSQALLDFPAIANGTIQQVYSSLNGESFGAKELGVAMIRNSNLIDPDCLLMHPADCYGDLGAASGAVLLALSSMKKAPILCYASSEQAFRGAACVV